jgi:hypothetical protein
MRCSKPFAAAFAFALLALTGAASAQTKDAGYSYHFDDDAMVGDTLSTTPPLILVRRPSPRIMLLRPRGSFVSELLKSVEAL